MRIIQVDQQARAVVNLVLSASLIIAALVILCYRLIEPTQLQLYRPFGTSFLVGLVAIGAALLLFDLRRKANGKPILRAHLLFSLYSPPSVALWGGSSKHTTYKSTPQFIVLSV